MTTRVDPRLAERRRTVAEGNARQRLRRVLWGLTLIGVLGTIGWLAQSPWFSIAHIAVSGVSGSDTHRILERAGVVEGTPLVMVGTRRAEELLESDPWILEAEVRRVIPDAIEVVVNERVPLAWVQSGAQWAVIADDSTVLRHDQEPGGSSMMFEPGSRFGGGRIADPRVTGGVTFLAGLPAETRDSVSLTERDGELWANVGGLAVRLGLPTEMGEKATALLAILEEGLPPGSIVNLVAPARPAVIEA